MTEYLPAIVAVAVTAFAVVSRRLSRSVVTGTMVFTALGLIVGPEVFDLVDFGGLLGQPEFVSLVLTGTLVVVLFTDASAINASSWRDDIIPARLLANRAPGRDPVRLARRARSSSVTSRSGRRRRSQRCSRPPTRRWARR